MDKRTGRRWALAQGEARPWPWWAVALFWGLVGVVVLKLLGIM